MGPLIPSGLDPALLMEPQAALPGGIHPEAAKDRTREQPIRRPERLPDRLILPLQQHIGAPAEPLVAIGDRVRKGELVAAADGWVSLPLHAPTSGTITAIGDAPVAHPSGLPAPCIQLQPDGEDRWTDLDPLPDWTRVGPDVLLERIRDAGIAGLGGAGFPTGVKLTPGDDRSLHTLIIDGAECEPYITADDRLMRERADELIEGARILARVTGVERCLLGIEDDKPEAIRALATAIGRAPGDLPIRIAVVPTRYPSGGEKQLIQMLTGREVPAGGLPADLGVLCQNVATLVAVQRALVHGEPLIERIVTLAGEALTRPGNLQALIGTPFSHLLADAGLDPERLDRLIMGGPMMGFTLADPDVGLVKTSNCILAASTRELPRPEPARPCIRCGMCEQVCPASLLPQQLFWYSRDGDLDAAREHHLADCIECGACAWVCPSAIPLVQYYRHAKGEIREREAEARRAERARRRFEVHQERIRAREQEREARRAARAEAARKRRTAEPDAAPDPGAPDRGTPEHATPATIASDRAQPEAAGSKPSPASPGPAPNPAQRRARLETLRARRQQLRADLDAAHGEGADGERLQQRLEDLDRRIAGLEDDARDASAPTAATPYAAGDDAELERLSAEADRAHSKARRTRGALRALEAGGADARKLETMRASLRELEETAEETRAALESARHSQGRGAGDP